MYNFDVEKPTSIADAVAALASDDEAQALGGGQTLIPTLKQRLASPSKLVSLSGVAEMQGVSVDGGDGVAEDVAEEDVTAIAPEVKRDGKVRECASVCVCVDVSACVCMYASP